MKTAQYTYLLEHPEEINANHTKQMREVIDAFPFFQSAHALYLKGLKNQGSFIYNKVLKKTAAHTTDRAVLFDYITSSGFTQNAVSNLIKKQEQEQLIKEISITDAQDLSIQVEEEEQQKASQILDPGLFIEKENSEMTRSLPEEKLQLGLPLPFTKNEAHSFGEWLKLAAFTPIDRSKDSASLDQKPSELEEKETPAYKQEQLPVKEVSTTSQEVIITTPETDTLSKKRRQKIVDSFIETNPKIAISPPSKGEKITPTKTPSFSSDVLMTETLARVYVEQKNFKKAKQAFKILSLKYPEKSGFFADQIRAVEQIEAQKE